MPDIVVAGYWALNSDKKDDNMVIPESAVLWTRERSVVYIKTSPEASIFEMREVKIGNDINVGYIVLSSLVSGDEILINGTSTVDAAAQFKGAKSMLNEDVEKTITGHEGHEGTI